VSEALDLMCSLRLEDGRCWGDVAEPVQLEDASAILDGDRPYNWLGRSRGYSKTTDEAGVTTAAMLAGLPDGARLYAAAADQDQSRLLVDLIGGFARRTPGLRDALRIDAHKVTAIRSASVLEALAADAAGTWGLRPDWIVIDELCQWPATPGAHQLWDALMSSAAKVETCKVTIISTAGDPGHWSRKVLDHALANPLWRTHEVPGPAPWLDPARVEEQRVRLQESMYRRLFLNEWASGEDRLVTAEDLAACVVLDGPLDPTRKHRYVIGLDVGLKRDSTVACVAHLDGTDVVLDRIATWTGSRDTPVKLSEVEAWLRKAATDYRASIVADPWQAAQLCERLRRRGVHVKEFTFSAQSVGRIASTLYLLLREHRLRLPDDEALLDELRNVRLRETSPGVLRMDHDAGRHDDRAIALALAAHRLVERGEVRPGHVTIPRGRLPGVRLPDSRVEGVLRGQGVVVRDPRAELARYLRGNR
jgi:phage terminase large subunit-like protein